MVFFTLASIKHKVYIILLAQYTSNFEKYKNVNNIKINFSCHVTDLRPKRMCHELNSIFSNIQQL